MRIYFISLALISLCLISFFTFYFIESTTGRYVDPGGPQSQGFGVFFAIIFTPILIINFILMLIAVFTASVRSKFNWIFLLIIVCLGLINPYALIPSAFMLIILVDKDVRNYYKNKLENNPES